MRLKRVSGGQLCALATSDLVRKLRERGENRSFAHVAPLDTVNHAPYDPPLTEPADSMSGPGGEESMAAGQVAGGAPATAVPDHRSPTMESSPERLAAASGA